MRKFLPILVLCLPALAQQPISTVGVPYNELFTLAPSGTIYGSAGTASAVTYTIFGTTVSTSAPYITTPGVLAQGQLPTSTGSALYTGTSTVNTYITSIELVNASGSSVSSVTLYVNGTTAAYEILAPMTMAANTSAIMSTAAGWQFHDVNGDLLTTSAINGTVTSVSFTGGLISVGSATTTPALTVAGNNGGIPYFSSASSWASSAALTQYGVLFGGGAGSSPTASAQGASNMPLIGQGAANPVFSSIAYPTAMTAGGLVYGSSATALANLATTAYGVLGAGATNPTWIATSGTSGVPLVSGGSSTTPSFGTALVAGGGTGATSLTAYAPLFGGTTSTGAVQSGTAGTANQMLASGGSSAVGSYKSWADLDSTEYAAGGGTAQAQTVTLAPPATLMVAGLTVMWKATAANTAAAPTLTVNGLSSPTITKCGQSALVANDILTTAVAIATYDGTYWELLNPQTGICGTGSSLTSVGTISSGVWNGTALTASYVPAIASLTNYPLTTTGDLFVGGSSGAAARLAAGALNMPLVGQGASATPAYSTVSHPSSCTQGGILYGSTSTAISCGSLLTQYGVVLAGASGSSPVSTAQGASNMPLIGQGAANPIFSTIAYPTSMTAGYLVYGSSPTALAGLATTAYSALMSGATNPTWVTPTGNGQCLMSGATSYGTTTPSFQTCPSGGSPGWSSIGNPTGNLSLTMAADTTTLTYNSTTGSAIDLFELTDTASNTGTGNIFRVSTASGSAAHPVRFDSNGNGVQMSSAGALAVIGTGAIAATTVTGLSIASGGGITETGAYTATFALGGTATFTMPTTSQTIPGIGQANTWSTAQTFSPTSNQLIFGAGSNLTTLSFPTSSGAVTVTAPNVTSTLATLGANTFTAAQTITAATNQLVLGTTNTTTLNFAAPASSITVIGPIVASGLVYATSQPSAGIATFAGSTYAVGSEANVTIAQGGTNATSAAAGTVPNASSTSASSWTAAVTLGVDNSVGGTLQLANPSAAFHTILASAATANYTFTLPPTGGTNGYSLTTNGSGTTSWSNILTNPMNTLGDLIYENSTPAPTRLAGNTTSTKNFLVQTGNGTVSAAPVWGTIASGDLPAITLDKSTSGLANPTADATFTYPITSSSGLTLAGTAPASAGGNGTTATTLFNISGVAGGATSSTGTNTGGVGSSPAIAGGTGGAATGSGTTSTVGGAGGTITITSGTGGAGGAGNDSGGAGGNIALVTGAGGAKSGSGTAGVSGAATLALAGGTAYNIPQTIATGTTASSSTGSLNSLGAITSTSCATLTISASGVASTDVISFTPNAAWGAVTGFTPATTGGLAITAYPTTNNVNFQVCNWSTGSLTVASGAEVNWRVER